MSQEYKNINDDNLDKLFKDAADNFVPPGAPEGAWDNFYDTKLNVQEEKKSRRGFKVFLPMLFNRGVSWRLATVCCLVGIAVIWFGLERWGHKSPQKPGGISQNTNMAVTDRKIENLSSDKKKTDSIITNLSLPETGTKNEINDIARRSNYPAIFPSANSHITIDSSGKTTNNLVENYLPGSGLLPVNHNKTNNPQTSTNKEDTVSERNIVAKKQATIPQKPSVPDDYAFDDDEKGNNAADKKLWQVSLVGGSNLSMVSGTVSNNAGLNTGVMVQRRINGSRFSVETGIVRESMDYNVGNGDYTPDGKPVSSDVSNVRGTCTMVDVPVNVRYDVVHSKKNNAFVSTGVSAMWMANQNVSYDYTHSDGSTSTTNKNVDGQGRTVYAVTNVAVGYERKFKNTAVQVAPYVKIPLGNVGYGNLSLGSLGAQISIKQSF